LSSFWELEVIVPEKELKVVTGATQPLLLAKEDNTGTKRSKPTEDNKFCPEQVSGFLFNASINLFVSMFLIILEPTSLYT
jgi:hypothetical protein